MRILAAELRKVLKNRFFCVFLLCCVVLNLGFWIYGQRGLFWLMQEKNAVFERLEELDENLENGVGLQELEEYPAYDLLAE